MSAAAPQVSVIVATHNRRELLARCLDALARQSLDPELFEVIVADDGSGDGSAEMVAALATPYALRVLPRAKEGKAAALNAAIEVAAGTACLFLDDDCIAAPGLLAAHAAAYGSGATPLAIGNLEQAPPRARDWYAHAFARAWNDHHARLAEKQPGWTDCYGGNFSAPRQALRETGGFATDLAVEEDTELGYRLHRWGCEVVFLPGARALHDDQKLRGRILEDARRQGAGHIELARRHPAALPKLLGWFSEPTGRDVALRRLLIALRVPASWLAALGRAIPGEGRRLIWFYFVSRYAFWAGMRRSVDRKRWLRITRRVPILMYHGFGASGEEASRYVIPGRAFARQMRVLALLRRRPIAFGELVRGMREGRLPPRGAVVITIDDGYRDNLEVAHPVLSRHGFGATLFLVSRKLAVGNDWDEGPPLGERPTLSAGQARELHAAGHEIGAHTRHHCSLPEVDEATQREEIEGSKRELEAALGAPVATFAYPYGARDERAIAATGAAGFDGACTTHPELARYDEDPLRLPRLEIRGTDSLRVFLRKLWCGGA